jgi:hypothetical protein
VLRAAGFRAELRGLFCACVIGTSDKRPLIDVVFAAVELLRADFTDFHSRENKTEMPVFDNLSAHWNCFISSILTKPLTRRRRVSSDHGTWGVACEVLEVRALLHANPVEDAEHLAVFGARDATTGVVTGGLVPDSSVTYESLTTGNWSAASTWGHRQANGTFLADGTTPGSGDNVLVTAGTSVTVDGVFTTKPDSMGVAQRSALHTIRVDGTLQFATNVNTSLLVDTIIVEPIGTFQMGTATQRIAANVKASVIFATGAIDTTWDPYQFSKGLVSHGAVSIYGSTVTSFEQATTGLSKGATSLHLAAVPTGWRVGDSIVITGDTADNASNQNQDETPQIASISGSFVTLTAPLKFNHSAGSDYVADTTRNATFSSENTTDITQRGHVMFMHNPNVVVDAAGFYGLGRTDKSKIIDDTALVPVLDANGKQVLNPDGTPKMQLHIGTNVRGRYAVHFHRTGTDDTDGQGVINDSAVVGSPGWGIVNHSSNVDVSNNVVYNVFGADYVTEAGDEIGDFRNNIAIHSQGTGGTVSGPAQAAAQDFGQLGVGFWLQGGNVSLNNNVAAGQRAAGFILFFHGLNQAGLGVTTISGMDLSQYAWADPTKNYAVSDVPLLQFDGNSVFASGSALQTWFSQQNVSGQRNSQSVVQNFTAWNLTPGAQAIQVNYTNMMTFKNVTLTGSLSNPSGTGIIGNITTLNLTFTDMHIAGFSVGLAAPADEQELIQGGSFNNLTNILVAANSPVVHGQRVVNINDLPGDPIVFTDNLKDSKGNARPQLDIALQSNLNRYRTDLSQMLNLYQSALGKAFYNGAEIYYAEQAANYVPFNTAIPGSVNSNVPSQLLNQTNLQLWNQFGLAVGGIVAPAGASTSNPKISGLVGPATPTAPLVNRTSDEFVNTNTAPYYLSYTVPDPTNQLPNGTVNGIKYSHSNIGNATVSEGTATTLQPGWNLVTRTILNQLHTFLIFNDIFGPQFQLTSLAPQVIHQEDLAAGAVLVIQGTVTDNYQGTSKFRLAVQLNDPKYIGPVHSKTDPNTGNTINVVTLTFNLVDKAGNLTVVAIDLTVT